MPNTFRPTRTLLSLSLALACACGSGNSASSTATKLSGKEGEACDLPGQPSQSLPACQGKLKCVASLFTVGVCGRGCKTDTDCGHDDEICYSYSNQAKDGHCVNLVKDEYAQCGVGNTSRCDGRSCLYLPNEPIGVCIDTCALDGTTPPSDAGVADEDAGTVTSVADAGASLPVGAVACAATETCVDNILSQPMDNEGVCGTVAKRGDACGILQGIYCPSGDVCAPENPADPSSKLRCFQDCSTLDITCDKGTKCVLVQDVFAYCM
ncbi:MAG: hypothetical protein ACHQ53_05950 [Polyangiales bacterium]